MVSNKNSDFSVQVHAVQLNSHSNLQWYRIIITLSASSMNTQLYFIVVPKLYQGEVGQTLHSRTFLEMRGSEKNIFLRKSAKTK